MNDIDYLSVIAFTGKDAGAFLQNQLTADVRALEPGDTTFAALCHPKGRVMALFLVCAVDDGYRLLCHRDRAGDLVAYLRRFVFRDDVTIEPAEDLHVAANPPEDAPGIETRVAPLPGLCYGLLRDAPAPPTGDGETGFHARELQAGVAWIGAGVSEQFLPQMLGHEALGALDFRKGCFPGQEVVARTRYLGKLKRHPWTGHVGERLPVDALGEVTLHGEGQTATGVLVDQAPLPEGGWQAFVVARRSGAFEVERAEAGAVDTGARGRWLNEGLERAEAAAD